MDAKLNVLGEPLAPCSENPLTPIIWAKSMINCNQAKTSDPFRIPTFVGQSLLDN